MFKRLSSLTFSLLTALAAVAGFFQLLQPVQAADLIVNPGESIQAAIDAAGTGDTIIIQAGSYTESFTINKAISLTGVSSDTVILHAEPDQRVITVTNIPLDRMVTISGVTIRDGDVYTPMETLSGDDKYQGGGIFVDDDTTEIVIQNSIFINNAAIYGGAISFYYYASVYVINCRFEDNYARGNGSAINAGTKR